MEGIFIEPPWPVAAVVGIAVAIAAMAVWSYQRARSEAGVGRRALLLFFRLGALAAITIVLLRPVALRAEEGPAARAQFSVLVDATGSMNADDVSGDTRSVYVARQFAEHRAVFERELLRDYDVAAYTFGNGVASHRFHALLQGVPTEGRKTDVGAALFEIAARASQHGHAGVLLVSDGRENVLSTARQAAAMLKAQQVPVWTATVGTAAETQDLYVTARLTQDYLVVDQPSTLHVTVTQTGYTDWYADVAMYREDEFVSRQQVMMKQSNVQVTFPVEESRKGPVRYRVEVEPLAGEADIGNNTRTIFSQVVDEKHKVLYVEAKPYWDSKFMLRTLQQDPQLEVTSVFQLRADKLFTVSTAGEADDAAAQAQLRSGVALPRTRSELYDYDCVILGRDVDALFTAEMLGMLRDFVSERGGSLVFARGRAYAQGDESLSAIEPVAWDSGALRDIRIELTEAGKRNPAFAFGAGRSSDTVIRELPEMVSVTRVREAKSLSVILAKGATGEGDGELAAIAYQRYGKGKVMSIGATGLWRWAFLPADLTDYEEVYARFWSQMIRWLVAESDFLPGQDIAFDLDRYAYDAGEAVTFVARTKFMDEAAYAPLVSLTAPDGTPQELTLENSEETPDRYAATMQPDQEGEYRAVLHNNVGEPKESEVRFTVYADSIEDRFVASDPELMGSISDITGGEPIALESLDGLPEQLAAFRQMTREDVEPVDVWDRIPVFFGIIFLLACEWFLRRRIGLV